MCPAGSDGQRHRSASCARRRQPATSTASASVRVRQSRSVRPSRTSATTGGSPRRAARRAPPRPRTPRSELGERERAAADARDRLLDLAADEPGEPLGPRATASTARGASAARARRALRRRGERERPSSAASVSLSRASARWSGCRRSRSTSPPGRRRSRLRAAEQLVAREADEVGAARGSPPASARRRRGERAGAEVVDERHVVATRDLGELGTRLRAAPRSRRRGSSTVHRAGGGAVSGPDRALVVRTRGCVRRPDPRRAGARSERGRPGC
jgi:hypothetical protein